MSLLTPSMIDAARPSVLADGDGLFLKTVAKSDRLVLRSGSDRPLHTWLFRFRSAVTGAEKSVVLGWYPDVSITLARSRRDQMAAQVKAGEDPVGWVIDDGPTGIDPLTTITRLEDQ
ncbi:Arm DNA-binding domain-containing protein [Fluviibacterium sp. DFM31]|uniref:Arm DNA-binding domain-containing protein n=1 Tax=Meridianimarinicoccus marinus TaxID=3231483 RepID=A0ABV3LBM4_9RHOB